MIKTIVEVIAVSISLLFSSLCLAEENPSDNFPVGGGRTLTQAEVAYNEGHNIYAVNDPRSAPKTQDEIAENNFAQANMGRDAQGNAVVIPKATGQRQIISSRRVVNEQGQIEGIPDANEIAERKALLKAHKEKDARNIAGMTRWGEDDPVQSAETEAKMKEASAKADKEAQDKIERFEKDAENYRASMKTLVSLEKTK
jgi:hypothetical protein